MLAYNYSTLLLISLFSALCLIVLWKRRKLYVASWKLPGPIAFPFTGNIHNGLGMTSTEDIFKRILYYMQSYGRSFRFWMGPKLVIGLSLPEDLEIIYNNPVCFEKDLVVMKGMSAALGDGLITAPVSVWKTHRKLINPTFNPKILNGFIETFVRNADNLVKKIEGHAGKGQFNIFPYLFETTVHFICETSIGIDVNTLDDVKNTLSKYLDETMAICFQRMAKPWLYPDFLFYLSSYGRQFKRNMKFLLNVTDKVIKKKKQDLKFGQKNSEEIISEEDDAVPKRKIFIDQLMELNKNGVAFTDKQLADQINTFITGGSDTSAVEVSFACMLLGSHPKCQEKAYAEIQEIFGDSDRDITAEDLPQMKYIERVLKETLRFFPPLPCLVRYLKKPVQFSNIEAPAGSTLLFTNFIVHRDPKIWPDPLKFDPDRFLPEEVAKRHPYSYVPFGGGPRNCLGYRYAMMSMKILLCSLLREYKFKSNFDIKSVRLTVEIILKAVEGHPLEIELRKKVK